MNTTDQFECLNKGSTSATQAQTGRKQISSMNKETLKASSKCDPELNNSSDAYEGEKPKTFKNNHKDYWEIYRRLNHQQWKTFKEGFPHGMAIDDVSSSKNSEV